MSSYLNFYLVPKEENAKPLIVASISRASEVYAVFYENLHPAFIGNGDEPQYTELTGSMIEEVINSVQKDIDQASDRLNKRVEAYQKMCKTLPDDAIEDYTSTMEYIDDLKSTLGELNGIYTILGDLEFTDFKKILINID